MFTGIIDHCGTIQIIKNLKEGYELWITHNFNDLTLGESIAVDGVCLTVSELAPQRFRCDVSKETLAVTTIKHYTHDQLINLERSLLPTSRLGGHFVTAHVDKTMPVLAILTHDTYLQLRIYIDSNDDQRFLIKKGSVAINGVSLTINSIEKDFFEMMLIPHTLHVTNLSKLKKGDYVNVEFDMLAKIISKQLEHQNHA